MKKVLLAVFSLISISAATYAQTAVPAKKAAPDKMKAVAPADKKESAKVVATDKAAKPSKATKATKVTATPAATTAATTATPVKKDGTPDKRYKANKTASAPTKKDGTPDMRYKENKAKPKS